MKNRKGKPIKTYILENGQGMRAVLLNLGAVVQSLYVPDAVNHLNFPSPVVKKGEQYKSTTIYKFRNKEV